MSKPTITAPIIGATRHEHLETAIGALNFSYSEAEIALLEAHYVPHVVDGVDPSLPAEPPVLTPPSRSYLDTIGEVFITMRAVPEETSLEIVDGGGYPS